MQELREETGRPEARIRELEETIVVLHKPQMPEAIEAGQSRGWKKMKHLSMPLALFP
jgi:hypothetical protein